jgi:guanylate kinase
LAKKQLAVLMESLEGTVDMLVICGPSGGGKSTLVKKLLGRHGDHFRSSVSYTTRAPREGEMDHREYHFVSREEFRKKIEGGEFVEHAEYSGNLYGTGTECARGENGKVPILEIEQEGVKSIRRWAEELGLRIKYVFLSVGIEEMKRRIRQRGGVSETEMEWRVERAKEENAYGASGDFDLVVGEGSNEEETYGRVIAFLMGIK